MSQYQTSEEIALLIADRLGDISVANDYETDIGLKVFRGKRAVMDEQVPCCVLIEGADNVEQGAGRLPVAKITQQYILGGYNTCDVDNPNDAAHEIIRDLKKAIFIGDVTLGGKVSKIEYKGRDIGPRTDGTPIVFALIEISVTYIENLTAP